MATTFVLNRTEVFPNGTSVGAYPVSNWPNGIVNEGAAPIGSATNSQTMTSGTLTFTGLTDGTRYVAYASVASQPRYIGFKVGTTLSAEADQVSLTTVDAKGDLLVGTADNAVTRRAVGTNGQVLTADSAQSDGVKWAAAAGGFDTAGTGLTSTGTTVNAIAGTGIVANANDIAIDTAVVPTLAAANVFTAGQTISHANGLTLSANGGKDTLNLSDTTSLVGITIGGDCEIWRQAADTFRTSDTIQISTGASLYVDTINGYGGATVAIPGALRLSATNATSYVELVEQSGDPAAPAANEARMFTKDNGSGKTQACFRFASGATQVIATEP